MTPGPPPTRIGTVLLLAAALAWIPLEIFFAVGGGLDDFGSRLFLAAVMFGPAAAAVAVEGRSQVLRHFKAEADSLFRVALWACASSLVGFVLLVLWFAIALALEGPSLGDLAIRILDGVGPRIGAEDRAELVKLAPVWVPLLAVMGLLGCPVVGLTFNLPFALGEEILWRGTLQDQLNRRPLVSALSVGVVWGLWHAPLAWRGYNFGLVGVSGVVVMVVFTVSASPLFAALRKASGSIVAPAALHGTINAGGGLLALAVGPSPRPLLSIAMASSLVLAAAGVVGWKLLGANAKIPVAPGG